MSDWEVKVRTESNYIKTVRVDDCFNRSDAEFQALSSTGAKEVIVSNPISYSESNQTESDKEIVEVHHYHESEEEEEDDDEDYYNRLDEAEIEMYDLMCQIAMEKDEELPTIEEFYDYLNS